MTNKLTSVWFAYVGWRKPDEDCPSAGSLLDLILEPLDSYESALWSLRKQAAGLYATFDLCDGEPDWSLNSEAEIRETFSNDVLVEIREVQIVNHTATGWRTLNLKAADDALRIPSPPDSYHPSTYVPAHRFQTGLSANNEVTRCVVSHKGKDYFGPWRGDEASALKAALLLIQEKE